MKPIFRNLLIAGLLPVAAGMSACGQAVNSSPETETTVMQTTVFTETTVLTSVQVDTETTIVTVTSAPDATEGIVIPAEEHEPDAAPSAPDHSVRSASESDAAGFVLLTEAVPDAILEIRYYSTYNFVGERIHGYDEPVALLTAEAAAALKQVSDDVIADGYRLKIYDAYRPCDAVSHFEEWASDVNDTRMKQFFYPDLSKRAVIEEGYVSRHSSHSRGSTVDLTLFDMTTQKEADMGGTFDFFGDRSHTDYAGVTDDQHANRIYLRNAMNAHGFRGIEGEWWHFTLRDEPYPDMYFTFPVSSDAVAGSD